MLNYKTTKEIQISKLIVDQVIGQEHAVNIVKKAAIKRRNVLLIGSPGTGKSLLGQALAELLPQEKLMDVVSFPNFSDENIPLIKLYPKAKGKEIVNQAKIQVLGSSRTQNIILLIFVVIATALPYYFYAKNIFPFDSPVIYAASIITSMIFIIGFMLFLNLNKRTKLSGLPVFVPKLLIDNSEVKKAPFHDACLLPGQKIFANSHPVKIEDSLGHKVYNAEGKKQKVVNVERIPWKGKVYNIKPRLLFSFTATQNHPFLVLEKPLLKQFKEREFNRVSKDINKYLKWKKAEELSTRDLLIYPELEHPKEYASIKINNKKNYTYQLPKEIILNEELAEVFGWYLAEGYVRIEPKRRRYTVGFSLSSDERKEIEHLQYLIKKIFNLNSTIDTHSLYKKELELLIYSRPLTELFKQLFDTGAKNKVIPKEIFESPKSVKLKFLQSYIQGDGWESKKTISVATTSKNIADDLVFLFSTLGIFPCCSYRKMKDSIKERIIKGSWMYEFQINGKQLSKLGKEEGKYQHYFSKDKYHFIPIKKVWAEEYKGDIINMETEDGTYLMPCITHNTGAHAGALLGDVLHDPLQCYSEVVKYTKIKKTKSGLIQIKEENIANAVNKIIKRNKSNLIKQDDYVATFLNEELQIIGFENNSPKEVKVLSVNKHKNKHDKLIKLTTESGKELLVTPEHKVAVKTLFNNIKYIPAEAIKPWHKLITI